MTKSRNINSPRRRWQPIDDVMLMVCYPHSTANALAKALKTTKSCIYNRANHLGLSKSQWFKGGSLANGFNSENPPGLAHRFPKGHVPANKGIKGISYPGMEATQFKKGHMPATAREVGSYRFDKDGTLQRKIGNASGNNSKRWRSVHELVWVEAHGPVPPKHICVFKPGMRTSTLEEITLDKVECISLAENMRRNTFHNYGKDIAKLVQLKGAITGQINKRKKNHE